MDEQALIQLLEAVGSGRLGPNEGAGAVRDLLARDPSARDPSAQDLSAQDLSAQDLSGLDLSERAGVDLGHSMLDTDREKRCGHPEIVFGGGKTPTEIADVMGTLVGHHGRVLATRVSDEAGAHLRAEFKDAVQVDDRAHTAILGQPIAQTGHVAVISAGTSDGAVAREATITARFLGAHVEEFADVGVAGIHRVLNAAPRFRNANAIIVVAGMEGALPSVVGGLVDKPVVAVPTSVGYGAAFGGVAALLGMLNSCSSGVTVVNIDNGFGAGFAAAQINRQIVLASSTSATPS